MVIHILISQVLVLNWKTFLGLNLKYNKEINLEINSGVQIYFLTPFHQYSNFWQQITENSYYRSTSFRRQLIISIMIDFP